MFLVWSEGRKRNVGREADKVLRAVAAAEAKTKSMYVRSR